MTIKVLWWKYFDNSGSHIIRVYDNKDAIQATKDMEMIKSIIGDDKEVFLDDVDFFNPEIDNMISKTLK
jgi:hypothetical protein